MSQTNFRKIIKKFIKKHSKKTKLFLRKRFPLISLTVQERSRSTVQQYKKLVTKLKLLPVIRFIILIIFLRMVLYLIVCDKSR